MRLGVSPAAASTHMGVFNQRFEALFPCPGALGCVVCFTPPAVPPSLSMGQCGAAGSASHHLVGSASCSLACPIPQSASSLGPPDATLPYVLSTPAARLRSSYQSGCMFLFYLLGVRLPCPSIFCQFWLFFVFKLLLSLFWLCEEVQCVYLHLHLGWKFPVNFF